MNKYCSIIHFCFQIIIELKVFKVLKKKWKTGIRSEKKNLFTFGGNTTGRSAVKWSNLLASWAHSSKASCAWALWRQITWRLCRWRKSDSSAAKLMSPDTKITVAGGGYDCGNLLKLCLNLSSAAFFEVALMWTTVT